MNHTPNPEMIDDENPEWTDEMFSQSVPAMDAMGGLLKRRGKQKKDTKILTSIRLSGAVLDYFKSGGEGWQTRLDQALQDYVAKHKQAA